MVDAARESVHESDEAVGVLGKVRVPFWARGGRLMDLGLEVSERDGFAVLAVRGEIDVSTAPGLRERLIGLVNDGWSRVVVDLEGVDFLDSTGLGVLVAVLKRLESQGGELRLVCTRSQLLKVFEITGLNMVFSVFETVDAAVAGSEAV